MKKALIHTSTASQTKPIIDFFSLKEIKTSKYKIYSNDNILLIESGVSKEEIIEALEYIFENFMISKAFDISIASCLETSVKLGTLFCTNKFLKNINYASLTSLQKAPLDIENIDTLLVDYQAEYFKQICEKNIQDYYILKIVSDFFDEEKLKEDTIAELIKKSIPKWENLI